MAVRVALIGAGVFAKDGYLPLLRNSTHLATVVAVWSRTPEAVADLLPSFKEFSPDVSGCSGHGDLEKLLQRKDIDAVIVVLPVQAGLQVTQQALACGKHVLQEKPMAAGTAQLTPILEQYCSLQSAPVWGLAENYRSEAVFLEVAKLVDQLGSAIKIDLVADIPIGKTNKYFGSTWRRDAGGCPGGFITDSVVHYIAALRLVANAAGLGEVASAAAAAASHSSELPPPDSLVGFLRFEGSTAAASVSLTFAAPHMNFSLTVVGTEGTMQVQRGGWSGSRGEYQLFYRPDTQAEVQMRSFKFTGLQDELAAFVHEVQLAKGETPATWLPNAKRAISPLEGFADLAVVEALLLSSVQEGAPVAVAQAT